MAEQKKARSSRTRPRKRPEIRDLSHLTRLGVRKRRMRYLRDARTFLVPILFTIVIQSLVYFFIYTRTGRTDWKSGLTVIAALSLVPVLSAFTLSAFRRNRAPISAAIAVVLIFFSFAVTLLSAMRLPLSYSGLLATLPVAMLAMAFSNIRFHRSISDHVGLVDFGGARGVVEMLGQGVTLIGDSTVDLSQFDMVLIDPEQHHTSEWSNLLARCYLSGVEIMPWTTFIEIRMGRVDVESFDLSHLSYSLSQILYARVKRTFDIAAVLITLPATLLLAGLTAGYIFARDGGPVLFVQHRHGFGDRVFRIYKFRTMYKGTGGGATGNGDKRIIPGCNIIRRARLDELPQLYNILVGDMSLIGPRPEAMDLVKWYRGDIPQWNYRTLVLPGVTGWAQVNSGYTSNINEARVKLAYDLYYIKYLSFDLDLQILFKTVRTVLFGTGAR
ncbi:Sugar transferase involved in LPS biosynthesis (colanic, teichoic acid) [Pelagibacterium halotolerans]|uniref:Sugar transferase n=2 Tax=Pelagibacterium TaxID=1082930 RepID=G4RGX3_PELHB|nr:sugar transferase [Pelagibacterium halotolerans]AEQ53126.1 sugar transferase [Pelagibacterium halotolerans B2]SEA88524.1 Sugar transferase involved in LPS biosynthesis (colanic, teichoic acid) [Pelagibacterium halotolerans]